MKNCDHQSADAALNVLMVSPEYPPYMSEGGLGTHVAELARGHVRRGCRVTVLAPTSGAAAIHQDGEITIHLFCLSGLARDPSISNFIKETKKQAAEFGRALLDGGGALPDLIHCHDWTSIAAARELGGLLGRPVVGTVHLLQHPLYAWWGVTASPDVVTQERDLCCESDALITVSKSMCAVVRHTYQIPEERIRVVYNGLNAEQFNRPRVDREKLEELRLSLAAPDEKIVIFAGRLVPQKGVAALLASAARVVAAGQKVRYVLVGGNGYFDPNRSPQQEQARILESLQCDHPAEAELWGHVKVLGIIPRAHLAMLYQVADLAVVPSIYEPFGYVAAEAMAAGLPVVATDVGGLPEIIRHGRTGWLVPVRVNEHGLHEVDVAELTEAQLILLSDEALARQLGEAGRSHVLANFNTERMIESTLSVYRQTIEEFRRRRGAGQLPRPARADAGL